MCTFTSLRPFVGTSGFRMPSYALRIVLLSLGIALLVDFRRRKMDRGRAWLLRPSNILILLGVGFYVYKELHDPLWDTGPYWYLGSIGWIIIAFAFAIRKWEEDAVRDIDEPHLDEKEKTGGGLPPKE